LLQLSSQSKSLVDFILNKIVPMLKIWISSNVVQNVSKRSSIRNEADGFCGGSNGVSHSCKAPNRWFVAAEDAPVGTVSFLGHLLRQIFDDVGAISSTPELVEGVKAADSDRREAHRPRNQPVAVFQKQSG